jgi:hypothetical protein
MEHLDKILGAAGAFIGGAIRAFVDGDDSEPVRRVVEILPPELRTQVEYARQLELARVAAEAAVGQRDGGEG